MTATNRLPLWCVLGLLSLLLLRPAFADDVRCEIEFPNLPGYVTVKCDLHMHTVFSDGEVWPTVRVAEAWRQGLDAISITDHLEYQPHKQDVATRHNRPYDLAAEPAAARGLLLVRGAEITRDTPPGHFNAIFTSDNEELAMKDFLEAIQRASGQGAFVFWNHQGWKGPEKGRWLDVHTTMFENKWFQGMEVCNGDEYYPDAHQWCLEKKLTMLGNSDIHDPDLRKRSLPGDHRTMTLVFAKAKSLPAIKEALMEGRTAVWYKDQIIGRKEFLEPLFGECVQVVPPQVWRRKTVWVQVQNKCDADVHLKRSGNPGPSQLTLRAQTTTLVPIAVEDPTAPVQLTYTATNFLIAPDTGLPVTLTLSAP
jgi:hypothetical protein